MRSSSSAFVGVSYVQSQLRRVVFAAEFMRQKGNYHVIGLFGVRGFGDIFFSKGAFSSVYKFLVLANSSFTTITCFLRTRNSIVN